MNTPKLPCLIATLLLVAGCVQAPARIPRYEAPADGPDTAKLQLRSPVLAGTGFVHTFDDGALCVGPHQIAGSSSATRTISASSRLKAGAPSTLYFHYRNPASKYCGVALTFMPEAGHNYLAAIAANESSSCLLMLMDITDQTDIKPVKRRAVRTLIKTDGKTPFCKSVDLEAEFAKAARPNRSGLTMSDLGDILPPETTK